MAYHRLSFYANKYTTVHLPESGLWDWATAARADRAADRPAEGAPHSPRLLYPGLCGAPRAAVAGPTNRKCTVV